VEIDLDILTAKKCPYCGEKPELVDSIVVYGKSYGNMYLCKPCDAYVGTHWGTHKPLGRLANDELRAWKKVAHASFDPLWQRKMKKGYSKAVARGKAYKWLSRSMGIHPDYTHIGMFDIDQCMKVVALCEPYLKK
jgi:hypothetical protein